MKQFQSGWTAATIIDGWRYLLDADAAGTTELSVGIRATDDGTEKTVALRNSILDVSEGIGDADAVVEIAATDLVGTPSVHAAKTVSGDADAFGRLVGLLDTEVVGFPMHQR